MLNQDLCLIYVDFVISKNIFVFILINEEFSQTSENSGSQNLNKYFQL